MQCANIMEKREILFGGRIFAQDFDSCGDMLICDEMTKKSTYLDA